MLRVHTQNSGGQQGISGHRDAVALSQAAQVMVTLTIIVTHTPAGFTVGGLPRQLAYHSRAYFADRLG